MYSPISKILTDYKEGRLEHWEAHDKILRLFHVSGRSNQLLCGNLIKHNFSLSKIGICYECKFIKDRL